MNILNSVWSWLIGDGVLLLLFKLVIVVIAGLCTKKGITWFKTVSNYALSFYVEMETRGYVQKLPGYAKFDGYIDLFTRAWAEHYGHEPNAFTLWLAGLKANKLAASDKVEAGN